MRLYCEGTLIPQVNDQIGHEVLTGCSTSFGGIYQWTVNVNSGDNSWCGGEAALQIKFGPSAWKANEADTFWSEVVASERVDYSKLFVASPLKRKIVQTDVSMEENLLGLDPDDDRLGFVCLELLGPNRPSALVDVYE